MPQKMINTPEELQISIQNVISAMMKDPDLAKLAAANPVKALSLMGYEIRTKSNGSAITLNSTNIASA